VAQKERDPSSKKAVFIKHYLQRRRLYHPHVDYPNSHLRDKSSGMLLTYHWTNDFTNQDANGNLDLSKGLRDFIIGMGGEFLDTFTTTARNSEVRNSSTYGVLKRMLHATSYGSQFVHIAGQAFTDSGTQACH
jgi:hypothetical protein